jgi:hypothetical protein
MEKNWKYCQNSQSLLKSFFDSFGGGPERTNDGTRRSNHGPQNRKKRNSGKFKKILEIPENQEWDWSP